MLIVWDEPKRRINLDKHGLDFADLDWAFFETSVVTSSRYGRWIAVGVLESPITVVFSLLGSEAISVISMRRASVRERKLL